MSKDSIRISPQHGVNPSMMLCFWCGGTKGVALLGALPNDKEAPRLAVYDYEPCEECATKMAQGITIMEVANDKLTGAYLVVKEEAFNDLVVDGPVKTQTLQMRKCYMDPVTFRSIIPKEE